MLNVLDGSRMDLKQEVSSTIVDAGIKQSDGLKYQALIRMVKNSNTWINNSLKHDI